MLIFAIKPMLERFIPVKFRQCAAESRGVIVMFLSLYLSQASLYIFFFYFLVLYLFGILKEVDNGFKPQSTFVSTNLEWSFEE